MISTDPDPMVNGLHLRTALRQARSRTGMTQSNVGTRLKWSAKKVYRLETGETPISREDAQALAGLYGMDPDRTKDLLDLAQAAFGPAWWTPYRRIVSPDFGLYLSCERAADALYSFHPSLVQGLLQTEQYARAILGGSSTPVDLPQRVKLRQARRELFGGPKPPRVTILLGEAALHNRVGDTRVMCDQLLSLREEATGDRVELGIVPFKKCIYPAMLMAFDLAQLPSGEVALYLELPPVSRTTQDETVLNDLFGNFFAQIRSCALFGSDAAALIDATLEERARGDCDRNFR